MAGDDEKCVYVLGSESQPGRYYIGLTSDLGARLAAHNRGESAYTAAGYPWRVVVALVFADPERARAFERYLKSGSGREFAERHFR
jgi:predicted GIY-YIG superfamily endonuclease